MKRLILLAPLALVLAGCGGSSDPKPRSGEILDSAVAGLTVTNSGGRSGATDAKGTFGYFPGEPVVFSVGGIVLGSAPGAAKLPLTALDGGALTQKVTNTARLLQTLDTDGNPENGIEITDAVSTALKSASLDLTATDAAMNTALTSLVSGLATKGLPRQVRSRADAREHLESTLAAEFGATGTTVLPDGSKVTKSIVSIPAAFAIPYAGADAGIKAAFPAGFPLSIASGLAYRQTEPDGTLVFWGLTDRGPNADSPDWVEGAAKSKSKVFPVPTFNPRLVRLEVKNGAARVASVQPILTAAGLPLSGRPIPAGTLGSSGEAALTESLKLLSPASDPSGLDLEGVAVDPANPNTLWLCDEYGPFILKVDAATGRIQQKFGPGAGLPALLQYRQANRGFEGVAAADGKVHAIVQSILDFNQAVGTNPTYSTSKARFLRLVELDAATGGTRMYAYPHDVDSYAKSKDAKLGDLLALGNGRFLVVEQGVDKEGAARNRIYLIDLSAATDISDRQSGGKELEALTSDAALLAAGVVVAKKQLLVDLRAGGADWAAEKLEGLTILPDGQTLVIGNDNDFGIKAVMSGTALPSADPTDYTVDAAGTVTSGGTVVTAAYRVGAGSATERPSRLWFIRLPKPLAQYGF